MKIGIVTFFCVPNYGAMLQAYALWKYLEGCGHEVEFIDYAFGNTRRIPLWKCFIARHFSNYLEVVRKKLKSHVSFDIVRFSDGFPRTMRISSYDALKEVGKKYDAVIVGSDQVWNPMWCSKDALPVVMLDFVREDAKRVSYAASFGTRQWRQDQNATLASRLLNKFDAISVREKSGVDLVRTLSGRSDARWLLDPTMLDSLEFYQTLAADKRSNDRYIFSYMLDEWLDSEDVVKILDVVKASRRIGDVRTDRTLVRGLLAPICKMLKVKSKVSVSEWLSLIKNADFVVTNSFHGTVFSILFHRPFITIPVSGKMAGMNERVTSLLSILGLESRIYDFNNFEESRNIINAAIDWEEVDMRLSGERKKASDFIKYELEW